MTKSARVSLLAVVVAAVGAATAAGAGDARGKRASLAPLANAAVAVSTHDPFGSEDCAVCHVSGDTSAPGPVKDTTSALCLECHDDPMPAATHRHGGASGACIDCHNPHNSMAESLLHQPVTTLCASCHAHSVAGARTQHTAIAKQSCVACHAPHGSSERRLFTAPFIADFYAPYRRESYALCFTCHKPELVEAATTTTATQFRDGERNLHAVHVARDDGKGRTCSVCHAAHAANNDVLVAESVPFGSHGWRLPVGFRKTENGGGCAKTCHLERSYARR